MYFKVAEVETHTLTSLQLEFPGGKNLNPMGCVCKHTGRQDRHVHIPANVPRAGEGECRFDRHADVWGVDLNDSSPVG